MTHIAKEEVLKIARLSNISVRGNDIDDLMHQLDSVLSYAARVKEVVGVFNDSMHDRVRQNKTRDDIVKETSTNELLAQVPVKEGSLIVVPMILENI